MKMASIRSVMAAALVAVAVPGVALAQSEMNAEKELGRGAVPDTTPQQRYNSAIREAGGGMKVGMAECKALPASERKGCEQEVRERYKADMAAAREMLRNPEARPVNVTGGPIRAQETMIKP
jgi:hypothetical protein